MILRFVLEVAVAVLVVLFCGVAYFLYRRIHFPADRTLSDAVPFLRPVDREEVEELVDEAAEGFLRHNLGEREFRKAQKKRIARLLEQAGRMAHNAGFLREWARRERKTACTNGDEELRVASESLVNSCIEVRGGALAIQFTLRLWRLKALVFPPTSVFYLATLRKIDSFDLVFSYERLAEAAMDLSRFTPESLQESLEQRL